MSGGDPHTHADLVDAARATLTDLLPHAEAARSQFPLPGGVLTVATRDAVVAEAAFGMADVERGVAMRTDHAFLIGSISKILTSLSVNRLIDMGALRADTRVGEVLTWLGEDAAARSLRVTDLLTHTGGLITGADAVADDAGEVWGARLLAPSPSSEVRFHYSNLGYQILGEVVRACTGRGLAQLEEEWWLRPLSMTGAAPRATHEDRQRLAPGYWPARPDRPWAPGDAISPAPWLEGDSASGNVVATGADLARLAGALLGAATNDPVSDDSGEPIIRADTLARMITTLAPTGEPTHTPLGVAPVEQSRYGMGINVERVGGHLCLTHGGGMVGYSTFLLVDVTAGVALGVLTNANGDTLAAHLLARAGHADLVRRLGGEGAVTGIDLDPASRARRLGADATGGFRSRSGAELWIGPRGATMEVHHAGEEGALYQGLNGRFVTDHPRLRRFHLDLDEGAGGPRWTHGPEVFAREGGATGESANAARAVCGHYRCYSPWYPEFRVYERDGRLLLAAPGGVEAPDEEIELVELREGVYRVGADPWLPERLVVEAARLGEVVLVSRDGLRYSRVCSD
jgi:D-alanyl-D-alanine carboxypeptidase